VKDQIVSVGAQQGAGIEVQRAIAELSEPSALRAPIRKCRVGDNDVLFLIHRPEEFVEGPVRVGCEGETVARVVVSAGRA
jgi:hypothetical protein